MSSTLGWIDFSSEHRDRVKTILDLLASPGVVDELGIGIIRDAFADYLFPGISTLQTRAKYFIIVPRILKDYEQLPTTQRRRWSLEQYLNDQEKKCRIRLVQKYGKKETLGIIGVSFGIRIDREVQRQPSSIYWNGLREFGIVRTDLSLAEFCRKHSDDHRSLGMVLEGTSEERGDDVDADETTPGPLSQLPKDEDWINRLAITLSEQEGDYLHRQIAATQPDSLLGHIFRDTRALKEFLALRKNATFDEMASLPFITRLANSHQLIDSRLAACVRQAKLFWDIFHGAHIRYNCILQDRFGETSRKDEVDAEWADWRKSMRSFRWKEWDTHRLWEFVLAHRSNVKPWTRRFIEEWISLSNTLPTDSSKFNEVVTKQEERNKQTRARLRPDNEDEQVGKWIGIRTLDYRLPQAIRIADDIYRAETGKAAAGAGL